MTASGYDTARNAFREVATPEHAGEGAAAAHAGRARQGPRQPAADVNTGSNVLF